MEKVFIYYRVSTALQDVKMQKHSVDEFLKHKDLNVIDEFTDIESGEYTDEREAFSEMLKRLEEVNAIVVYDWDRLSRNERFAINFVFDLRDAKIVVYQSKNGTRLDFEQLGYRLSTIINSVIASEERLKIKKRQKDGIKKFKKDYGYWGRKIFYGINPNSNRIMSKKTFWEKYEQFRVDFQTSKSAIARIFQMGKSTLFKRLYEDKEKDKEIDVKHYLKKREMVERNKRK